MASALTHTDTCKNGALNGGFDLANAGSIKIYASGGTPPVNAAAAIVGTLLGSTTLGATAFGAASVHTKALSGLPLAGTVSASGTADYYRIFESDGTTVLEQGSVGTSGCDMNFAGGVAFVSGGSTSITSFTITAFA